jgi:hypothetical protein
MSESHPDRSTPALTGQTVNAAGDDLAAAIGRLPHEDAVSPL